MEEALQKVLNERIRPALYEHGGDIRILGLEDGVLRFRLLGRCSGCPSAAVTAEELVGREIREAFPEIRSVVLDIGVSEELIGAARDVLRKRRENGN
ncbi:MAG: NifU family protein [Lachnospiraceae bacterium]|nr:NifU family protein [Lachnospiraceae bacterium]